MSQPIIFAVEPHASFDVCTNSGYLYEAMQRVQQQGGSIHQALLEQDFSLVRYDGKPDNKEIQATLFHRHQRAVITDNGGIHFNMGGDWFEVLIAPAG